MKKWYSLLFALTSFLFVCTFVNALSDLQITACESADQSSTCDRLDELGLVTRAQCCSELGRCCGTPICPDGVCATGENCPQDMTGCSSSYDTKCYEPTCVNGCGQVAVASGLPDESCYGSVGCTGGNCTCDGVGSCFSRTPICPDGVCATGENCPADADNCTDTKCYEPTCVNGCGKVIVYNGQTDEVCYGSIGCTDGSCTCDGNGNCTSATIQCKSAGQLCSTTSECCSGLTCDSGQCAVIPGCSFDNNCVKCGNSCILNTLWNNSCALPTVDFDCKCVNGECVYTTTGKKITTKPTTPPIKEVSLCDGCSMGDTCLEIGTQRQESEGTILLYCSVNKKMETAKNIGENCDNDYECLNYNCEDSTCAEKLEEEKINYKLIITLGIIILAIGLVFLTFKLFSSKKSMKEETKPKKEEGFEKKFKLPKYKYEYKPEFDVLEKKLKESLGKIKK